MLTNALNYAYYSSMGHDIIVNHSGSVSQGDGRVGCPGDGLRILARLIARDLVSKHKGSINSKKDKQENELRMPENG